MSNCAYCNKKFTCGFQKVSLGNGVVICKACKTKNNNLNQNLAKQKIKDLVNIQHG